MKICIMSPRGGTLCGNSSPGNEFVVLPHDSKIACAVCVGLNSPNEFTATLQSGLEVTMRRQLNKPVLVSK